VITLGEKGCHSQHHDVSRFLWRHTHAVDSLRNVKRFTELYRDTTRNTSWSPLWDFTVDRKKLCAEDGHGEYRSVRLERDQTCSRKALDECPSSRTNSFGIDPQGDPLGKNSTGMAQGGAVRGAAFDRKPAKTM
jgi:hypothetical protein